jgi:hypothetical protein
MSNQRSDFVRSAWCARSQYALLGLIADDATLTLKDCAEELRREFSSHPNARVSLEGGRSHELKVSWGPWEFRIAIASGPQIASESASIARQFARHRSDRSGIAACRTRIEVTSTPDPFGEHMSHYFSLGKVLARFDGVFLFCIAPGNFWDEGYGYPLGSA